MPVPMSTDMLSARVLPPHTYGEQLRRSVGKFHQDVKRAGFTERIKMAKGAAGYFDNAYVYGGRIPIRRPQGLTMMSPIPMSGIGFKFAASGGGKGMTHFPRHMQIPDTPGDSQFGGALIPTAFARKGLRPRGKFITAPSGAIYQNHSFRGTPGRIYYPQ